MYTIQKKTNVYHKLGGKVWWLLINPIRAKFQDLDPNKLENISKISKLHSQVSLSDAFTSWELDIMWFLNIYFQVAV